jgi:hypothetical protein
MERETQAGPIEIGCWGATEQKTGLSKFQASRTTATLETLTALADPTRREIARPAPVGERQVPVGHGRLRCFQSCAFHLIVVAVQHLPVCIHKVHLAVAGRKLVP